MKNIVNLSKLGTSIFILFLFFLQIVVDPSGNSFVENPHAPRSDPHRDVTQFLRTREQDHALGLYTEAEVEAAEAGENLKKKCK